MAVPAHPAKNKYVLVTGGNRGVGLAIVTTLLRDSQMHVMMGSRDVKKGEAALRDVLHAMPEGARREAAARAAVVAVDVTDEDSVHALAQYISTHHANHLDVLINNAGIASKSADPVELEPAKRTLSVNYQGMRRVSEALLPALQAARGRVVKYVCPARCVLEEPPLLPYPCIVHRLSAHVSRRHACAHSQRVLNGRKTASVQRRCARHVRARQHRPDTGGAGRGTAALAGRSAARRTREQRLGRLHVRCEQGSCHCILQNICPAGWA